MIPNGVDIVSVEPFWIDSKRRIAGLVERASVKTVLSSLGVYDTQWLPVVDAVAAPWANLANHQALVDEIEGALRSERDRLRAGLQATALFGATDQR